MQEISLNILDIVQNSIKADASLVQVLIDESTQLNYFNVQIIDNGCGMDEKQLSAVVDPFFTTRTTRKVGLGVPFFKMAAEMTGGSFEIKSSPGKGTVINANFVHNSIDRMPLGDMASTMASLVQCSPQVDFIYRHTYNGTSFEMNTREFRQVLGDVPLNSAEVVLFISDYINENYKDITKGGN